MMNEKAFVSKDLSAKHTKILEDLLKLPENRECADCKSRAPRWASVNLGVFICMQCSGIHRSLGVHISKVRSTTLDTWLPEQVAFMKCVGNRRSNEYWEAALPQDYDRSGIENFICAKYVNKTWVAKNAVQPNPANYDKLVKSKMEEDESKSCMQRRVRRLSLEEEVLAKHVAAAQISPPIARHRGYSLDMMDNGISSTKTTGLPPFAELNSTIKTTKTDLYKLPYTHDDKKKPGQSSTTPSSWATFDFPACRQQDPNVN